MYNRGNCVLGVELILIPVARLNSTWLACVVTDAYVHSLPALLPQPARSAFAPGILHFMLPLLHSNLYSLPLAVQLLPESSHSLAQTVGWELRSLAIMITLQQGRHDAPLTVDKLGSDRACGD